MKDNLLQTVFWLLVLVVGAALEELLPKFFGVGFPALLATVQLAACGRMPFALAVALAVAAGGLEDALSSLPMMTTVSYFVLTLALVRGFGFPRAAAALTYPCYQLWLSVWTGGLGGGIFARLLLSVPIGLVTAALVGLAVDWLKGKAAIDEQG